MRNTQPDTSETNLLIGFFERLVAIMQSGSPYIQATLASATMGKMAVIQLDGHKVRLDSVKKGEKIKIRVRKAGRSTTPHLAMRSDFLKDWASGLSTLDNAIFQHKILIYGRLEDVTSMYNLILNILADSPLNPEIQQLWSDFERDWPFLQKDYESPPLLDAQLGLKSL